MPKLLEHDQEMFNMLMKAQSDLLSLANVARFNGLDEQADLFIREAERCSRDRDNIISKYVESEIITEVINGTIVTGTREYVEWMRRVLTERTVNVNVVCLVRTIR